MKNLYQYVPPALPNFFERLFNIWPGKNVVIEINNLLATRPVTEIPIEDINQIYARYKFNVYRTYTRNLYEFYAVYLNHCLQDNSLADSELKDLKHLQVILNLSNHDTSIIQSRLTAFIYKRHFTEAVSDGRLDEEEKAFLDKLHKSLQMSPETASRISEEVRGKFVNDYVKEMLSDRRLSPEEDRELREIAESLMIEPKMNEATQGTLNRYRLFWTLENGELTPRDVNINLQRNEYCYFSTHTEWHEQRTVTQRVYTGGTSARIKIAKGVYYRVSSASSQRVTSEEWKPIDSGTLYVTNKRILFIGSKKNNQIRLDKVLSFTPYSNAVQIDKDTGRSPLLYFSDTEVFCILLARMLREL